MQNTTKRNIVVSKHIPVLLYVPNLLGYLRIILALTSLKYCITDPDWNIILMIVSCLLDMIDGPLARRLDQCSQFGVWVDIVADNLLRTISWLQAIYVSGQLEDNERGHCNSTLFVGSIIICTEWLAMHCIICMAKEKKQSHWKDQEQLQESSFWKKKLNMVKRAYFANNFKNPVGIVGIFGMFGSGILTYCCHMSSLRMHGSSRLAVFPNSWILKSIAKIEWYLLYIALFGRFISWIIEIDIIQCYVIFLISL
mmetsp:Transcript_16712/g.21718  ORF Transcript_16712/g.21718 Transcript_16712/m.21718 type:complete len:254 (+) Transcript_16712:279-1040(+)